MISSSLDFEGSGYSFSFAVKSSLSAESIYSILLDPAVLKRFNAYADTIDITVLDSSTSLVRTVFQVWGYRGESVYKRIIYPDERRIAMLLESFNHNWDMAPGPVKARADYHLDSENSHAILGYSQKVRLKNKPNALLRWIISMQLNRFKETVVAVLEEIE
ncbi:MAG: hypothetical protein GF401_18230 [Chitinivibrionales bacterium]|nr:hypothetical protein [Chitinivibrionales bacterium]